MPLPSRVFHNRIEAMSGPYILPIKIGPPIHLTRLHLDRIYADVPSNSFVVLVTGHIDGHKAVCKLPVAHEVYFEWLETYPPFYIAAHWSSSEIQLGAREPGPESLPGHVVLMLLQTARDFFAAMVERDRMRDAVAGFPAVNIALWLGFESQDLTYAEWEQFDTDRNVFILGVGTKDGWEPAFEFTLTEVFEVCCELGWRDTWPQRQPCGYGRLCEILVYDPTRGKEWI